MLQGKRGLFDRNYFCAGKGSSERMMMLQCNVGGRGLVGIWTTKTCNGE